MHKFWKIRADEVRAIASSKLDRLRQMSHAILAALPPCTSEVTQLEDQEVNTATWRDLLPDGRVRIVVQAYRYRLLETGTMAAVGFTVSSDGVASDLQPEDLYEYA
jgi:acylphosphatase